MLSFACIFLYFHLILILIYHFLVHLGRKIRFWHLRWLYLWFDSLLILLSYVSIQLPPDLFLIWVTRPIGAWISLRCYYFWILTNIWLLLYFVVCDSHVVLWPALSSVVDQVWLDFAAQILALWLRLFWLQFCGCWSQQIEFDVVFNSLSRIATTVAVRPLHFGLHHCDTFVTNWWLWLVVLLDVHHWWFASTKMTHLSWMHVIWLALFHELL